MSYSVLPNPAMTAPIPPQRELETLVHERDALKGELEARASLPPPLDSTLSPSFDALPIFPPPTFRHLKSMSRTGGGGPNAVLHALGPGGFFFGPGSSFRRPTKLVAGKKSWLTPQSNFSKIPSLEGG